MVAKKEENVKSQSEENSVPAVSVGKIFSEAREEKGFSLDDVVKELNIRKSYLSAIESDDFDKLPTGIYQKSYIKSYASILGLDSASLLGKIYGEKADNDNSKEEAKIDVSSNTSAPGKKIIVFCLFLIVAVYGGWHYIENYTDGKGINFSELFSKKTAVVEKSPVDSVEVPISDIVVNKDSTADHIEEVLSSYADDYISVSLLAIKDTKLEILDSEGAGLISTDLKEGETYFIPKNKDNVKLVSDISSFEVFANGNYVESIDSLNKAEDGIILNGKQLLSLLPIE